MKLRKAEQRQMVQIYTLVFVRVLIIVLCVIAGLWLLYRVRTLLLLLIISIFFAFFIAPIVNLFQHPFYIRGREIKLSRGVAILAVYLLVGGVLFFVLNLLIPRLWVQVTELTANLPAYMTNASDSISNTIKNANSWVVKLNLSERVQAYLVEQTEQIGAELLPWVQGQIFASLSYLQYLPWLILVPVLGFFLLRDASSFGEKFVDMMPNEKLKKRVRWMLVDMSKTIAAYIRAQITSCILIGILVTAGLAIIGTPYPVLLGLVAGIAEFVPLAGPAIAAVIIVSLTAVSSFKTAVVAALFLIVLRMVQDYVLYPRIIGEGIKIPPFLVIVAILAGAEIAGLLGIFFCIPVAGLILVITHHYRAYRGIETIRSENTALEPPVETSISPSG